MLYNNKLITAWFQLIGISQFPTYSQVCSYKSQQTVVNKDIIINHSTVCTRKVCTLNSHRIHFSPWKRGCATTVFSLPFSCEVDIYLFFFLLWIVLKYLEEWTQRVEEQSLVLCAGTLSFMENIPARRRARCLTVYTLAGGAPVQCVTDGPRLERIL